MRRMPGLFLLLLLTAAADTRAQQADFDYLLGDWRFTGVSKEHGEFSGVWSAVRLSEGQILDEYRVLGDSGVVWYATTTIRNYNQHAGRWELIGADAGGGLQDFGTARKVGDEMHIEQDFGVAAGTPSTLRIRYFNIRPDAFSWRADRSTDGGKTWVDGHIMLEARRVGGARTLPELTRRDGRPGT